jgi:hypothetical protein
VPQAIALRDWDHLGTSYIRRRARSQPRQCVVLPSAQTETDVGGAEMPVGGQEQVGALFVSVADPDVRQRSGRLIERQRWSRAVNPTPPTGIKSLRRGAPSHKRGPAAESCAASAPVGRVLAGPELSGTRPSSGPEGCAQQSTRCSQASSARHRRPERVTGSARGRPRFGGKACQSCLHLGSPLPMPGKAFSYLPCGQLQLRAYRSPWHQRSAEGTRVPARPQGFVLCGCGVSPRSSIATNPAIFAARVSARLTLFMRNRIANRFCDVSFANSAAASGLAARAA